MMHRFYYRIEEGIPVGEIGVGPIDPPVIRYHPPPKKRGQLILYYPLDFMKIGDSFFAAGRSTDTMRSMVQGYQKRHDIQRLKRFTVRRIVGGTRVWRVE